MRILDLALKDLSQILRDRKSLLFLLLMPVIFTLFMGVAMTDSSKPADPRLTLGILNHDADGVVSQQLLQMLSNSDAIRLVPLASEEEGVEKVRQNQITGLLSIPAGFSQQALEAPTGQEKSPQLTLIANDVSMDGQSLFQLVRVPVTRILSSVEIARLNTIDLVEQKAITGPDAEKQEKSAAFAAAAAAWEKSASAGVQVRVEKAQGAQAPQKGLGGNAFNQTSPGTLVQFAIFGLINAANVLLFERKQRTLQRLLSTAMRPGQIIAGHLLAMFILVFTQEALLILFGQWLLHVNYFLEPLATLAVMSAMALMAASLGLLIGSIAQTEDQVILFSLIAMFALSALGGAWFPLEGAGPAFASIGRLTPTAWAMEGFQNIIIRGLGFSSVVLPVSILSAYAAVFFVLAVWRFQKNLQ